MRTYYRKRNDSDTTEKEAFESKIPICADFRPIGPQAKSPLVIGEVDQGGITNVLDTNLFSSAVVKQKVVSVNLLIAVL